MKIEINRGLVKIVIITILVTVLITLALLITLSIWKITQFINGDIQDISGIVATNCIHSTPAYRHTLTVPANSSIYDKMVGESLWDIGTAVGLSNCKSGISIPPPFTNREILTGLPSNSAVTRNSMYANIFWNNDMACFAFTGTYYSSQWRDNLKFQLTKVDSNSSLDGNSSILNGCIPETQIHSGFNAAYQSIRSQLWNWWNNNKSHIKTLFITGHSLGGALATICAYDFAEVLPINNIVVYMFSSPRVGNVSFADIYNKRVPQGIRVYNTEDIIVDLPPAIWMGNIYKHVGNSGSKVFTINLGNAIDNHSTAYLNIPD